MSVGCGWAKTKRLRELLDERGVEWETDRSGFRVMWGRPVDEFHDTMEFKAVDNALPNGGLNVHICGATPEQAIAATLGPVITGDTSDGYHTFNELYYHRAVLFSVIVRDHSELAWKSKLHHDGSMYDGMFIVGIETPHGQATYHYDIDPYWDMFECKELDRAPEWDGHTPDESIARIATLGSSNCTNGERTNGTCQNEGDPSDFLCSECGARMFTDTGETYTMIDSLGNIIEQPNYCPNCGAKVVEPTTNDVGAEVVDG